MEAQSLEFKGLKRRDNSTFVRGSVATKYAPVKEKKNGLNVIPGELTQNVLLKKILIVGFYAVCVGLCIASILYYINLRSELSLSVDKIASMQNKYEAIKKTNDENEAAINNSIDYVALRSKAINELGMHYASEGQIVSYTKDKATDYVRVMNVVN